MIGCVNLPSNIYNLNESTIVPQIIFNNCKISDKAKHWTLLLLKEALSIHREKPLLIQGPPKNLPCPPKKNGDSAIFPNFPCLNEL